MKQLSIILFASMMLITALPNRSLAQEASNSPLIQSETAILIDANTGSVLFEKDGSKRMYPASLTKVLTAIMAIESGKLTDNVTVSKEAVEIGGTSVFLVEGEKVSLKQLVQGLLINSGNDAAVAIAEHFSGNTIEFGEKMNEFVTEKLGLTNTHFVNPHGLFDENHYTNAYDLAMMTKYALQNEQFKEIFGTKELVWDGQGWDSTLYTRHKLLRENPYEGIIGGKTGFVDESGITLITAAKRGDLTLIAVVLKGNTNRMIYNDTVQLLDYGFAHFQFSEIPGMTEYTGEDSSKYRLAETASFAHKVGENIEMVIDPLGVLKVIGDDGRQINAYELNKLDPESSTVLKPAAEELSQKLNESIESEQNGNSPFLIGLLLIIILCSSIYLFTKQRKYRVMK